MMIYLLRHAEAVDGEEDAARELSVKGRDQARRVGRFFKRRGWVVDAAYSSPLVRAVETLDGVLESSGLAAGGLSGTETPKLLNEVTSREFGEWVMTMKRRSGLLVVGHAPSLPSHAAWLMGSRREEAFKMGKAHLAAFEWGVQGEIQLRFFLGPKLMDAVGRG